VTRSRPSAIIIEFIGKVDHLYSPAVMEVGKYGQMIEESHNH
jgi:hypothetical protein